MLPTRKKDTFLNDLKYPTPEVPQSEFCACTFEHLIRESRSCISEFLPFFYDTVKVIYEKNCSRETGSLKLRNRVLYFN